MSHGTATSYNRGCRCDTCRAGRARYEMRRRKIRALYGITYAINATGTQRRIRALARMGWSYRAIAAECGWTSGEAVGQVLLRKWVERNTAAAVKRAYDALSMRQGPSASARRRAEAKGWPPPLAWDDETIDDPNTRPHTGTNPHGTAIDDIEWLVRCGGTWDSLSVRLGITKNAIEKALTRAGRHDVIAELARGGSRNQWNGEVAS